MAISELVIVILVESYIPHLMTPCHGIRVMMPLPTLGIMILRMKLVQIYQTPLSSIERKASLGYVSTQNRLKLSKSIGFCPHRYLSSDIVTLMAMS